MTRPPITKEIIIYQDERGREPFNDWLNSLRNPITRRRILTRLRRVQFGNDGDYKPLKDGVYELRFVFGPGYRVYFGEDGQRIVVLLSGGDKQSQSKDIKRAKIYWKEYLSHANL